MGRADNRGSVGVGTRVGVRVTAAMVERPGALGMLAIEEQDAWSEYLDATRDQPEVRYEELEPWAWKRLNQRLAAIQARRRALVGDDGA